MRVMNKFKGDEEEVIGPEFSKLSRIRDYDVFIERNKKGKKEGIKVEVDIFGNVRMKVKKWGRTGKITKFFFLRKDF